MGLLQRQKAYLKMHKPCVQLNCCFVSDGGGYVGITSVCTLVLPQSIGSSENMLNSNLFYSYEMAKSESVRTASANPLPALSFSLQTYHTGETWGRLLKQVVSWSNWDVPRFQPTSSMAILDAHRKSFTKWIRRGEKIQKEKLRWRRGSHTDFPQLNVLG